ncbi:MAG TPA: dihydrolipoamide acetyltransferase family protein [Pseudogracilibacillus sp.]|nr:dihydrolipoamide acetyltransferase family protein [Pseudogracilibacillus sp.]
MAKKEIRMPKLGESVTEGTINHWFVKVGDHVEEYDPLADVMTDKVNAEVPASFTGTIQELLVEEGETVEVGTLIGYMDVEADEDEVSREESPAIQQETEKTTEQPKQEAKPVNKRQPAGGGQQNKTRYSPAVMNLANEHNLDLTNITGTGLGGRITRKDVEKYLSGNFSRNLDTPKDTEAKTPAPADLKPGDKEIPLTGVRKVIADNMVRSSNEIPHAWMTVEVDVTNLVKYRDKIKNTFKEREGFSITYFAFFVEAVTRALKEYPQLNCVWKDDKIIQRNDVNMSIAVAKDEELFVPVIKNAEEKSIQGIAKSIHHLATNARHGRLNPEDMTGGTFTLNNTGTFGSVSSMGIINHPQVAILQVESIVKRPVIINDMLAARDMVNLSLSLDHRILDGLICGRFLTRVKEILEGMDEDNLQI